jgi:hypothetical protein
VKNNVYSVTIIFSTLKILGINKKIADVKILPRFQFFLTPILIVLFVILLVKLVKALPKKSVLVALMIWKVFIVFSLIVHAFLSVQIILK